MRFSTVLLLLAFLISNALCSWVWIPNRFDRFAPTEEESSVPGSLQRMTRSEGSALYDKESKIPMRPVRFHRTGGAILLG